MHHFQSKWENITAEIGPGHGSKKQHNSPPKCKHLLNYA